MMSEYNDDELVAPLWLNREYIQKIYTKIDPVADETTKVLGLDIRPAAKRGDHYASIMFRVAIRSERTSLTVIVKTAPGLDTAKGRYLSDARLFENELLMYGEVLPHFEAVWRAHGENIKFSGGLLYAALTPHPVIVLEDLCPLGYDVLRERLFNLNEVQACLHKLAKWHAVSHKVTAEAMNSQQDPTTQRWGQGLAHGAPMQPVAGRLCITQLRHGLFRATRLIRSPYMADGKRCLITALEEAGGFERFLPKLRAIEPQLVVRCVAMNDAHGRRMAGPIYVLNHGDFHTKNIMIRRGDGGALLDMLFVDFQMCFFGPSTYDLQYASFTLLSRELRDTKRGELLSYYFERFVESLRRLQFTGRPPTFEEFQLDCKRWRCFELFLVTIFLPLTKMGANEVHDVDINQIFDSAEYRMKFYRNPEFIAYLRELLPRYDIEGYLD